MEAEGKKAKKDKLTNKGQESLTDKENNPPTKNKDVKEKKSKRVGWKRIRHAALVTCRYIGLGATHMSPVSAYPTPSYNVDPRYWNRSFNPSYKPKVEPKTPHWTTTVMFSGW